MLLLIGKENCPKCYLVKKKLKNKKINFIYKDIQKDVNKKQRNIYINMARDLGIVSLPLILTNNKIIKIEEVL